jgi:heat shock protein HslJ
MEQIERFARLNSGSMLVYFVIMEVEEIMKIKKLLILACGLLVLTLIACQSAWDLDGEIENRESFSGDIREVTWEWERFDDTADRNDIVVEDPTLYTLRLNEDGTYSVKADCNMAGGGYELAGSSLKLLPGPTTLAECGADSLSTKYLADLGYVATYVINGDQLYLNLWADGGNMVFRLQE